MSDVSDIRARIDSHDPATCEHCVEYAQRRWRLTVTKNGWETSHRRALTSHVKFFEKRAPTSSAARTCAPTADPIPVRGTPTPLLAVPSESDLVIQPDHDEATCRACTYWAQVNVLFLPNIGELERLWVDRDPDDHIHADATDEQREFWRASFERTSRVIQHVAATRRDGEDAYAWHARVLRAVSADDPVAMHNVDCERDRRAGKRNLRGGMAYEGVSEATGSPENAQRIDLILQWFAVLGLEWAQGTRFVENLPDEVKLSPPSFMRKVRR